MRGTCVAVLAAAASLSFAGIAEAQTSPLPTGRTTYRDLPETVAELHALAAQYPDRVRLIKLSRQSLLGRDIEGDRDRAPRQ